MLSPQMGHSRVSARLAMTYRVRCDKLGELKARGVPRLTIGALTASLDVDATMLCASVSHPSSGAVTRSYTARFLPRQLFSMPCANH